ncbi:lysozyme inhibitor LprI family protein [Aquamicrobium sp. LC103]|uniref:lysozyme inhibitor LprI family protein n=1 Tax=Aquamicrobium sp. LC103 TaxID=1120658 RepID=UPI00063E73C7|nr:lysozyme inhibitor LprI family protein [Aquamicrobium sp. LC103]TKT80367.1 DUF1311 domain-containing protein [Aquamicrobium sp. LC103]
MRMIFAALLLTAAFTTGAQAADACDNAEDQATLNECANKAFKTADTQLNADYKEIEKRLADDADAKKLLVASQRAWVAYRDAECTFQSSGVDGGSVYPMIHANCLATLTAARVEDFKAYLSCEEGDMSCPVPAAD